MFFILTKIKVLESNYFHKFNSQHMKTFEP
jgi:hypothetical protein